MMSGGKMGLLLMTTASWFTIGSAEADWFEGLEEQEEDDGFGDRLRLV